VPASDGGGGLPNGVRYVPGRRRAAAVSDGWATQGDWWTSTAEAVADALAARRDPGPACLEFGRRYAEDGASLPETLDRLVRLYAAAGRREPPYDAVHTVSVAWAEESLQFLHAMSCEDPLTGLATLAHVRTRLDDLYREAERSARPLPTTHALLVVDIANDEVDPWDRALRLRAASQCLRAVFSGGETIGRACGTRALAVVDRRSDLPRAAECLRRLLLERRLGGSPRIWVEGLPHSADSAARLLDELARAAARPG
jgi:GGDEF domain-containing protein